MSTHKQTSERIYKPSRTDTAFFPSFTPSSTADNPTFAVRTRSITKGGSIRDYKKRIARHESATTSLNGTTFSVKKSNARTTVRRYASLSSGVISLQQFEGLSSSTLIGTLPTTPPLFSGSSFATAQNAAISKLYGQIRDISSPARVGESVGEYKETIRLLRKPQAGLQDLIKHISDGHLGILTKKWQSAKLLAKALADLTLEYRFGIKPLVNDLTSAYVSVRNRDIISDFHNFSAKGKGDAATVTYETSGSGGVDFRNQIVRISSHTVKYKGQYRTDGTVDRRSLNGSLGLTWRELIPTVYNLIPYTFLLDYVSNLNTFVETLAVPWSQVAWCVRTFRSSERLIYSNVEMKPSSPTLYRLTSSQPGRFEFAVTGVTRSDQTSMPLPSWEFKYPTGRQWTNVLALVAGRLPVFYEKTSALDKYFNRDLVREFSLATRDRRLKVQYPFH